MEGLTVDPSDENGAVCCALHGVAVDPSCLAGGDVRGEAEAGGVALGHAVVCCVWLVYRVRGALPALWWTVHPPSQYGQGCWSRRERQPPPG